MLVTGDNFRKPDDACNVLMTTLSMLFHYALHGGFNTGFRDCSGSWTLRVHLDGSRMVMRMNWRKVRGGRGLESWRLLIGCEICA